MSIIYKGLNPKHHYGLCILTINGELITANGKHFQAIQIPTPHGRIIDIDKVKDELRDQIPYCGLDMTYSNSNAFDTMDNAPTILEAEE